MASITSSWSLIKQVYCGYDGHHDVYWRMYARISAQSGNSTTVAVEGRLYISGNAGSFSSYSTTTCGGVVGNYSAWGVSAEGTYYVGETTLWSGSDTTTGTSIGAGVRFYASPWGWTGENLYISDTLTFEPAVSPPSGLSVSIAEVYTNGAKFNVSLSSYGNPASANNRYIEAGILNQNSYGSPYRYAISRNTKTATITVNNSSSTGSPSLTIQPNKQYYYGAYAENTQSHISVIQGQFVTKAEAPTVLFVSSTSTSATFSYSVSADGGYYNKVIQYSLDGGATWKDGATVTGSSAKSGSFTVNGLLSGASYTMQVRVSTAAGNTRGSDVSFDTLVSEEDNENILYGSANGKAKKVRIVYGSVNDEAKPITKLYGSILTDDLLVATSIFPTTPYRVVESFDPEAFKRMMLNTQSYLWNNYRGKFTQLEVYGPPSPSPMADKLYSLTLSIRGLSATVIATGNTSVLGAFGIIFKDQLPSPVNANRDYIILGPGTCAKLIHQGFGHIDYS